MNVLVSLIIKQKTEPVKGLTFTAKHLKTQTNLEISFTKKDHATLEFHSDLEADLAALKATGDVGPITLIVDGVGAVGRVHNRSIKALNRIGVKTEEIDWDADSGMLEYNLEDGSAADLPSLVELLARMMFRATTKFAHTRHPLTLFDLKQTCGLVKDAKDELGDAQAILDWFDVRELVIIEEEKAVADAKKAGEKEAADAKKAKVKAEKAKVKAEKKKESEIVKEKKVKAKAKAKKAKAKAEAEAEVDAEEDHPN